MKRAGKVHWLVATGLAGAVIAVVAVVASSVFADTPRRVAAEFMVALARGDAERLAQLSFIEGVSEQELVERWKYTVEIGRHYRFRYTIKSVTTSETEENVASAEVLMVRNSDSTSPYEEIYGLPLEKVDGVWKIDLAGIDRRIYPAMPR